MLFGGELKGQQGLNHFNVIKPGGNNENNVVVTDSGYVVLQQGNSPYDEQLERTFFGKKGHFVRRDSLEMADFYEDCRHCLRPYKNGFLKVATLFYSNDSAAVHLMRLNQALDTISTHLYSYGGKDNSDAYGLKVMGPNEILVMGHDYIPGLSKRLALMVRLDSNFQVVWDTTYSLNNLSGPGGISLVDVVKTLDQGYLWGGLSHLFPFGSSRKETGILIKTDSLGAEQWRKKLTGPEGNTEVLLQNGENGNIDFLTVQRQNEVAPDQYYSRLRMGVISQSGQFLKDSLIGPTILNPSTAFFEKTPDGNYLTGGYAQDLNWGSYSFKFKPNGDSIWFRPYFYGTNYFQDEGVIESMAFTPDSGMVFCGYFFNSDGANTWLIKTDKYGCDTAGCHMVGLNESPYGDSQFSVFPNPAQSKVTVRWQSAAPLPNLHFTLHNAQGKKLKHIKVQDYQKNQQVLDLSLLKPGLYLLEVLENEKQLDVLRVVKE